jgi:hypothetical protein
MSKPNIIISPKTKVGELLDNFPQLESVLMEMSPAFEKLKNPVLRKTVARVATLQQVAVVGGLNVELIVNRLRQEVGQGNVDGGNQEPEYLADTAPDWFDNSRITAKFDASPVINSGGSPMNEILQKTGHLNSGEIFELRTPLVPAPIIDMLKAKGYKVYSIQDEGYVKSYFCLFQKAL